MQNKQKTIIGINPGSKYLGIAVFKDNELRDWRTKVFKGKWSVKKQRRIEKIVNKAIERYNPDFLVIKKINPSRSSAGLDKLTDGIVSVAKENRIKVHQYSIKDMKAILSPEERINKYQMTELLVKEYQALSHEFKRENESLNPYHIRMFEAVALCSVCFKKLNK